jgi:hypothetical protein
VGVDLGDAGRVAQAWSHFPLQDGSQLHGRVALAANLELENLSERRRERADRGITIVTHLALGSGQPLVHQVPRVVDVGPFAKDDRHDGEAELRDAAKLLDLGQTASIGICRAL